MLTAIRTSDKQKVVGDFIDKNSNETYCCEYCENNVIHHKSNSKIKIGHFKHKSEQSFCPNQRETIVHLQTKLQIFNFIKSKWGDKLHLIELEKWICNKTIRPDIYIETKKQTKIAIEVQASVLTVFEIKRRTEKYFDEGIYVLWILPFDYFRFFEYKPKSDWKEDGSWGIIESGYALADKIRLKEYEIFIYWSYFKKIILWDLTQKHSQGFIVAFFEEYTTESVEFRQDGEEHYYDGRKTKVMKVPERIKYDVPFDNFKPTYARFFESNYRNYDIPERKIFTFDNRKSTNH